MTSSLRLGPARTRKFGFEWGCKLGGELGRRDIADRGVRPEMSVIDPPVLDLLPWVVERQEPVRVEALIPEAAIERFDERVVGRFAWPGIIHGHAIVGGDATRGH